MEEELVQLDEERAAIRIQAAWGLFRLAQLDRGIAEIDRVRRIIDAQLAAIEARRAAADEQLETLPPGPRPSTSSSSQ